MTIDAGTAELRHHITFSHPDSYPVCGLPVVVHPPSAEPEAPAKGAKAVPPTPAAKPAKTAAISPPAPSLPQVANTELLPHVPHTAHTAHTAEDLQPSVHCCLVPCKAKLMTQSGMLQGFLKHQAGTLQQSVLQGLCQVEWTLPITPKVRDWIRDGICVSVVCTTTPVASSASPEPAEPGFASQGNQQEIVAEGVFRCEAVLDGITRQAAQVLQLRQARRLWDERRIFMALDDPRQPTAVVSVRRQLVDGFLVVCIGGGDIMLIASQASIACMAVLTAHRHATTHTWHKHACP